MSNDLAEDSEQQRATPSMFKYLIVSLFNNDVRGTDSDETAHEYSFDAEEIVIRTADQVCIYEGEERSILSMRGNAR
jgi:hypothetical protein